MKSTNTPVIRTKRLKCCRCGVIFHVPTSRYESAQDFADRAEDIHLQTKRAGCIGTSYDFKVSK